jgi:amidohydrolase
MKNNIYLQEAEANLEEIRRNRRFFHQYPELGFQEFQTAERVAKHLKSLGLEVKTGIAGTGVVGVLRCHRPGRTAALRADMDALPMEEKNPVPYASKNPGIMHSCGHDGHTAMLMETARLLVHHKDSLRGNVKFIFQPCEDTIPSGAEPMIAEGVLNDPDVEAIFTVHLMSRFPEGSMWLKQGYMTISSAGFELTLQGRGGHVGAPHDVIDPIMMAGMLITGSQSMMSRRVAPGQTMIFGFGTIHGGTADNIVPDEVTLTGSIRTATPEDREAAIGDFERIVKGVVESVGGSYTLKVEIQNPSVYNDPGLVPLVKNAGAEILGENNVQEFSWIFPGGDDAAFFQQKVPGVYWYLGTRNEGKGFDKPHHNPYFDFDESMLAVGAAVQAQVVTEFLSARSSGRSGPDEC